MKSSIYCEQCDSRGHTAEQCVEFWAQKEKEAARTVTPYLAALEQARTALLVHVKADAKNMRADHRRYAEQAQEEVQRATLALTTAAGLLREILWDAA